MIHKLQVVDARTMWYDSEQTNTAKSDDLSSINTAFKNFPFITISFSIRICMVLMSGDSLYWLNVLVSPNHNPPRFGCSRESSTWG